MTDTPIHYLSKSRFTAGLQCHRMLWWRVHERDAPELLPAPQQQAIFDMGTRVGERAILEFPGGQLVDAVALGGRRAAIRRTAELLDADVPAIFEASFDHQGVFAAIDVLSQSDEGGHVLTEVKATTRVKPQHIPDAAVQTWIARGAGVDVRRVELMHLNRGHRHPGHEPLFTRSDVTEEVEAYLAGVEPELVAQRAMLRGPVPEVAPGGHCRDPYPCPFMSRCIEPGAPHGVGELYGIRAPRIDELESEGYERIVDVPADRLRSQIQARQQKAVSSGKMVVEAGLGAQLAAHRGPFGYLDFETIAPPLPVWHGCGPYMATPVQFSVHRRVSLAPDSPLDHAEFLAAGSDDPRRALAISLLEATDGIETVFAYNAPFEARCIKHLAAHLPEHASQLRALSDRLVDLLPMVRSHVYHPAFHGSFSLKAVAPALLGTDRYGGLGVADGGTATARLETLLLRPHELDHDRAELRAALLEYCKVDTLQLVGLHDGLSSLVKDAETT